jgi:two-component system response regulator PilR (NtrC family)
VGRRIERIGEEAGHVGAAEHAGRQRDAVHDDAEGAAPPGEKWPLQDYLDRVERAAINEALERTRFNRTAAAKLLGITFRAMRYRMERLGIK